MSDKLTCTSGDISTSEPDSLRATSTPIGQTRLSFSRLDQSLGKFDTTQEDICSTPKLKYSAVPIFGRKNVELAEHRQNNGKKSRIDGVIKIHKACQPSANVQKTFEDSSKIQPGSSATRPNQKRGNNKNILGNNKRRSTHNESRGPVFKVTPKTPKSPRLLTAMRAKLRANRNKDRIMNAAQMMGGSEKRSSSTKPSDGSPARNIILPVFNKRKITIPMSPKLRTKKLALRKRHAAEIMRVNEKKSSPEKPGKSLAGNVMSPTYNKYKVTIPMSPKLRTKKLSPRNKM